jgi:hypothetical protein
MRRRGRASRAVIDAAAAQSWNLLTSRYVLAEVEANVAALTASASDTWVQRVMPGNTDLRSQIAISRSQPANTRSVERDRLPNRPRVM